MTRTVPAALAALLLACSAPRQGAAPHGAASAAPTDRTPAQLARDAELAKRAEAVIGAFQNRIGGQFAAALTSEGRLVFGSNRDGSPQLYLGEAARPSTPPKPITRGPERVQGAVITRDERFVLFTRDRGADENAHVYRVGLDGEGLVDLTPGEGVRHDLPVLPLRRPELMFYGRRTVKSPRSTLLVQPVAGGEARVVYEDPAPAFFADVAPDGARALVARVLSPSEAVLLEVDVASGRARRLWPAEGKKERLDAAVYSADGATVFLATDQGGESSALVALDPATGKVKARWSPDPATAALDQIVVSPTGRELAVRLDAGNRSEVRLLDAGMMVERARPPVPLGAVDLGEFTRDGRRLPMVLSTPDRPGEPFALDVETGELAALRDDARPGLAGLTKVKTSFVAVLAFDEKPIPVHAYLPEGAEGKRLPVIVHFHGGPAASSTVRWNVWAQYFAGLGYAWVEPNVRGSTGFGRAWEMADNRDRRGDVLKDMEAVNRWVKAQPWADGRKVVIFGGSYGGWVVLMGLTRQPELWSAGIDLVGVADLRTLVASTDQAIRAIFVDEFGDLGKDDALLARWSPLADAERIRAPLFVYQGANDPRVPRAQSDEIVRAVRGRGGAVEYMIAADEGHSMDRRENQIEFLARTARFLEEHLK
jgi:dipeptidyl aminopeptidase/acylaminoacyl peptidase